ncbi:MAG TPA: ATP-binding cassette domain-containing protein [Nitrospiraceae bacterium]|nr:ATP-binding cassette domain-containing protein [Nitrospiraceae bacterium]
MTIVDIQHATVCRGEREVLTDLTLQISSGIHAAILGPNGAGKTTLLRLLSLETHPMPRDQTVLRLFARDRWDVWQLRRHLGVISNDLQHRYLDEAHGIHVILSGYYASVDTYQHQTFGYGEIGRAVEIMEDLGIVHLQDRPFGEMSTGEQRRFLLGRALVHDPEALVLDEPTSGLDLQACFHYLQIIRALMSKGKTVILVTHHIHEIPPEVTRVILLKKGCIVADGDKEKILTATILTELFDMPVRVVAMNGWYQALPG